jgi:hypothetical protein
VLCLLDPDDMTDPFVGSEEVEYVRILVIDGYERS